jgi:hypothetical protein
MTVTVRSWTLLVVMLCPPRVLVAQKAGDRPPIHGVVLDAATHTPLPNATVQLDLGRGVLTDSLGRFSILSPRDGRHRVTVKELGYAGGSLEVELPNGGDSLRFELQPGPLAVDGFTVVADRLAAVKQDLQDRRLSTGLAVRVLGQDRLMTSTAEDVSAFLRVDAGIRRRGCGPARPGASIQQAQQGDVCILARGRTVRPSVFVDDVARVEGLDAFEKMPLYDIYLIEVISGGEMIRVYSNYYIERLATTPQLLPRICIVC